MWDPSTLFQIRDWISNYFVIDKEKDLYHEKDTKTKTVFSGDLCRDILSFPKDSIDVLRKLNIDVCIVGAESGACENSIRCFNNLLDEKKKQSVLHIIKNTGHLFGTHSARKELFHRTLKFILSKIDD